MKKFRFSLKSLATVREAHEMRAREAFSAAVAQANAVEAKVAQIRQRISELEGRILAERGQSFRPSDQSSSLYAHRQEMTREAEAKAELYKANQIVEKRRGEWMLTRRDLRLIEKLEEKARATHQVEYEHELQLALDDRTNALAARTTPDSATSALAS